MGTDTILLWAAILVGVLTMVAGLLYLRLQRKRRKTLQEQAEKSIQEARDATELANLVKREFLSNVSHELRTPLNSLMSVTYLAEESELTAFDAELIEKLKSATSRLKTIIDTILDFSSLQNGELELETTPFNLQALLAVLADNCTPKAYQKGLEVDFDLDSDVPAELIGDPQRLEQVLTQLTDNAIKFSDQGEIAVSVELIEKDNDRATLKFAISDTGIGMKEEDISNIFQPFTQLDGSSTRRYGGLGMGLILSKQIVEKMGGEISVESQPEVGSRFSFVVELAYPKAEPSPEVVSGIPQGDAAPPAKEQDLALDLEALTETFQDLATHLKDNDSLALSMINGLRKKIPTSKLQSHLKELERLITLYEFDQAYASLSDLAEEMGISLEVKE